ncbi:hypothetical protein [Enterococcus innesii]|uniref:hypothetical protein n=1 Tax=Enterococcus innesii TaxID=2839759 RepID=UPI0022B9A625|nr:hypothetical protein [Enterococcus innesii]
MMLENIGYLFALLLSYVALKVMGILKYSKFLDNKDNDKKIAWNYYKQATNYKLVSEFVVLSLSIIVFFIEYADTDISIFFIVVYSLIIINSISNIFDTFESSLDVINEFSIPLGEKDRLFKYLKSKSK